MSGLGYLPQETTLAPEKQLRRATGELILHGKTVPVIGYEIHAGVTTLTGAAEQPFRLMTDGVSIVDGCVSADNQVLGTYLHGVFDEPEACHALLQWAGLETTETPNMQQLREDGINRLADCLSNHLNQEKLFQLLDEWSHRKSCLNRFKN